MWKNRPDTPTEKVAERLRRTQRLAAAGTADGELGRQVLRMLSSAASVSRLDLIAHFTAIAEATDRTEVERMQAREIIRRLQPLP